MHYIPDYKPVVKPRAKYLSAEGGFSPALYAGLYFVDDIKAKSIYNSTL